MNRTLLVLNMSSTGLCDVSLPRLCEVLSRITLSDEQVVERRRLRFEKNLSTGADRERSKSSSVWTPGRTRYLLFHTVSVLLSNDGYHHV